MSVAFENTTRSLANDINSQAWLLTIIAVLILSAWIAWSFLFPIPIYKSALTGRLEKAAKPVSIIAHRSGYIKHHQINVGQNISAQDILLRFDDNQELLRKRQRKPSGLLLTKKRLAKIFLLLNIILLCGRMKRVRFNSLMNVAI